MKLLNAPKITNFTPVVIDNKLLITAYHNRIKMTTDGKHGDINELAKELRINIREGIAIYAEFMRLCLTIRANEFNNINFGAKGV